MTALDAIAKLMITNPCAELAGIAKANPKMRVKNLPHIKTKANSNYILAPFHNDTGFLLGFIECQPGSNRYIVLGIDRNKSVFDTEAKAKSALSALISKDVWWHREDS